MALLTRQQVADLIGVVPRTIFRWVLAGQFPKPLHLTNKTARWRKEDVDAWLAKKTAEAAQTAQG